MFSHDGNPLVLRLWTWALQSGHTAVVSSLLELGMPPTQVHPRGNCSPIGCSAYFGRIGLVEHLLAAFDPTDPTAIEQIDQAFLASTIPDNSHRLNDRLKDQLHYSVNVACTRRRRQREGQSWEDSFELCSQRRKPYSCIPIVETWCRCWLGGRSWTATPLLYLADGESCLSMCNILISAGADVDHQDSDGNTVMLQQRGLKQH